jgi:hypothetical protein
MVLKKRISMKEYLVEVYNNTLKMWEEIVILAGSEEEAVQIIEDSENYVYSIISIKQKEE